MAGRLGRSFPATHRIGRTLQKPSLTVTADTGLASADGGTDALTFVYTAATGAATASGGTVVASEGLAAATGTATATGSALTLTVILGASGGTATAGGGDTSFGSVTAPIPDVVAAGRTHGVIRAAFPATGGVRYRTVPLVIAGLSPSSGATVSADTGTATAAGTASVLTVILAASSGAATAGGGDTSFSVVSAAIPNVVAAGRAQGTIRAVPATPALRLRTVSQVIAGLVPVPPTSLSADNGTATAAGGDASVSIVGQAVQFVAAGVTPNIVRAGFPTRRWIRFRPAGSMIIGGLAPAIDANLDASGGTATASGFDASASVSVSGLPPGAVTAYSTPGVFRTLQRVAQYTPPALGSRVFSDIAAPVAPSGTADGGVTTLTFRYGVSGGTATASGVDATATSGSGANVTAINGLASAAGGTDALTFVYAAATGTASATGGSVNFGNVVSLTATGGAATGAGGTDALTVRYAAAAGTATATGGTVTRVSLAAGGTATGGGGTVALAWTLPALAGTATAAGGSVVTFVPTFGHLDGGGGITGLDEGSSSLTHVDGSAALAGVIG